MGKRTLRTRKNRTEKGIIYQMEIANKAADGSLVLRFAKHFKLYDHLPNVSEKDVKGLLFRKQPLHTSPTTGAKAVELSPAFLRANVCELSHTFLRAMRASPHCPRREREKISFPSLRIQPFLLMVLASGKTNRLLQAREIRRIDFS